MGDPVLESLQQKLQPANVAFNRRRFDVPAGDLPAGIRDYRYAVTGRLVVLPGLLAHGKMSRY